MASTQGKQAQDTLGYLILKIISQLDEQDQYTHQIIERGCPAVHIVGHFLDLSNLKRTEWAQSASLQILDKPFKPSNSDHPWQYSWKLEEALKKIMAKDKKCRQETLKMARPGAAFRSAIAESHTNSDETLLLAALGKQGENAELALLELNGFKDYLKNPAAIPLLISLLDASFEVSYRAAETLILLTGHSAEFISLEDLSPHVSRAPYYRLRRKYMQQSDIKQIWQNWWKEVKDKIHWDKKAEFPIEINLPSRPLHGKFVW